MLLRPYEAAARYGISEDTFRRWTKSGKLKDHRTPGGHRRYNSVEIEEMLNISSDNVEAKPIIEKGSSNV
jgi:excisionase family DNA binding protein